MTGRARQNHYSVFKARVALAIVPRQTSWFALREKTLAELAQQFDVPANQITQRKRLSLEGAASVFGLVVPAKPATPAVDVKTLDAKIGELKLEKFFCPARLARQAC